MGRNTNPGTDRRGARTSWAPRIALATLAATAVLSAGCARVSVHTVVDPSANFTTYTTFAFLPDGGSTERPGGARHRVRLVEDPLYHAHVQEAIAAELAVKGFRPARESIEPDLLIGYQTLVRNRADVVPPLYGVGWRGRVYVAAPGHARWYKEGTLVIDMIDGQSRETVWRGVGVGAMRDMRTGEEIREAVQEILKDFPPK